MATLRNNNIGDIAGSIGGMTFSRNHTGGIVRFKTTNKNKNSKKQTANRNRFAVVNGGWHVLTDPIKAKWNEIAKQFNMTGINLFISCNKILNDANSKTVQININDIRPNDSGLGASTVLTINQIQNLNFVDNTFTVNNRLQIPRIVTITATGTGTSFYSFTMQFNNIAVPGINNNFVYANTLNNHKNLNQTLVIYGRNSTAQRADSRPDKFDMLLSFPFWISTINLSSKLTQIIFRAQGQRVRALFDQYLIRNRVCELKFCLLNSQGFLHEISRLRFTYT